jgi:ataxia telangiectasia mutated family protein
MYIILIGPIYLDTSQGHHIGEARLETSASIIQKYLTPALQGLKENYKGDKAGRVLHEFAAFCDRELHNTDLIEEFRRVTEAKEKRKREVDAYSVAVRSAKTKGEKEKLSRDAKIANRWYRLDSEEFERVTAARETLIQQCIENYLRSLSAWDEYDRDVLRLFSIWLEYSHYDSTNHIIGQHGTSIPSYKFAILMSQLTSLLQEDKTEFTVNLKTLILRICMDHPYHSLHHIFATLNNNLQNDGPAVSRKKATEKIAEGMRANAKARDLWNRVWQADTMYHSLAIYTDRGKIASGKDIPLDRISPSATLVAKIKGLRVPPATMDIPLRKDCDYSSVSITVGFKPKMTIASGISAPKILTAISANGRYYKQLVSIVFTSYTFVLTKILV